MRRQHEEASMSKPDESPVTDLGQWSRTVKSQRGFRLIVSRDVEVKEIGRLIGKLQLGKKIWPIENLMTNEVRSLRRGRWI
jgi:hypothetical protein